MRPFLPVFIALFVILAVPALAQNASDKRPGLNTDMGDMALDPGTALPPPGFEEGKVKRMAPGESVNLPPSAIYPDVPPANDALAAEGALAPTPTPEAVIPVPAEPVQAKTPLIP